MVETAKPGGADLVEVMFAANRVEAEMVQGLLESEGVPSLLQATGVNGPQLGVGLSPRSPQRVMVRAEHADLARRLLGSAEEDYGVDGSPMPRTWTKRGEGAAELWVIGAYARIWFWSVAALAVAFGIFMLARVA